MEALRIENLIKSFGGLTALNNVSLHIESGSRRVIIGPNGAGKTTLFNIISGYLQPTIGQIFFYDQNITFLPEHKRVHLGIGRTFQINNLFQNLTVLQNTILGIQAIKRFRYNIFRSVNSYEEIYSRVKELLFERGLWEKEISLSETYHMASKGNWKLFLG